MGTQRLEAFSDGVLAIIITVMLLEIKVPHGDQLKDLAELTPTLLSYILSFVYIGIYWNNHHHMMHTVNKINGSIMWANMHLLFWLSLVPFATGWMGENHFSKWPMMLYGFCLLMSSIAYFILAQLLIKLHGKNSVIGKAIGRDKKGIISTTLYIVGIAIAFVSPWLSLLMYSVVAIIWFIPDKRIENKIIPEEDEFPNKKVETSHKKAT